MPSAFLFALTLAALPAAAAPPPTLPTLPDTLAQRALACTGCHGAAGRATPGGYFPRLAGKPAGYLFQQLQHFRDGRRPHAAMARMLAPLSDDYLATLAGHFAALDLPYPPPERPTAPAAQRARGEALVRQGDPARGLPACAACHGERLTGAQPAVPGLLGLSRDYLNAQLGAWRAGQRQARAPDCMAELARALAPDEVEAVAAWLAAQPLPADPKPAAQTLPQPLRDCGTARVAAAGGTR